MKYYFRIAATAWQVISMQISVAKNIPAATA